MCNINEFVILYRHIESQKFVEEAVIKLFEESADIVTDTEKNMSFDKFVAICVDYNLFSDERQNFFLGIKDASEIVINFNNMKANWESMKASIEKKLIDMKIYLDNEEFQNWETILNTLDKRVTKENSSEPKPILIAFKVMESELIRLMKQKEIHERDLAELSDEEQEADNEKPPDFSRSSLSNIPALSDNEQNIEKNDSLLNVDNIKKYLVKLKSEKSFKLKRTLSKKF